MTNDTNVIKFTDIAASAYSRKEEKLIQSALHCLESRLRYGDVIADPFSTEAYLRLKLLSESREVFAVLFLNTALCVIAFEKLFYGTIHRVDVCERVVAQRALAHNASALILAHNHPSGTAQPSTADKHVTEKLKTVMKLFDIPILDHFIIAGQGSYSFAEGGLL